jgi:hypothetical protein
MEVRQSGNESSDDEEETEVQLVDSEEDFFSASSACSKLYFLQSRYIYFDEAPLGVAAPAAAGWTAHIQQRMGEAHTSKRLDDNTGGSLYDAAVLLARHLLRVEPDSSFRGARALELGAGPGLTAMVAAMLAGPAGRVVATDGNDMIVQLAAQNFEALAAAAPGAAVPQAARSPRSALPSTTPAVARAPLC